MKQLYVATYSYDYFTVAFDTSEAMCEWIQKYSKRPSIDIEVDWNPMDSVCIFVYNIGQLYTEELALTSNEDEEITTYRAKTDYTYTPEEFLEKFTK